MSIPVFNRVDGGDQTAEQLNTASRGLTSRIERLKETAHGDDASSAVVTEVLRAVDTRGDAAVVEYMKRWTDPAFDAGRIRVEPDALAAAESALEPKIKRALARAIENVRTYQSHIMPAAPDPITIDGATLGLRFTPVASAGLLVPGGKAAYPSTLIMLAVPALAAGVPADSIHIVSPPPTRASDTPNGGDISGLVLGAASMLGLKNVYRVGGAQAVAALAYGTEQIPGVDLIVGPGNVYTQLAKQSVSGRVGIDGFLGPSEIVTIADKNADPDRVASDLIAQAEHDPGKCFLLAWDREVIDKITAAIDRQLPERNRRAAIENALANDSAAVLVRDLDHAIALADTIAPEHLNLALAYADAEQIVPRLKHAGEIFLGDTTPVAAGDYIAGPSHCLPTGTTARFASGISVYTYLKRTGTVGYPATSQTPGGMPQDVIDAVATLATAEGLDAHAASARQRR